MKTRLPATAQQGFTLVEIAIVMVIVGILLTGVTGSLSAYRENANYASTERYLEEARKALLAHVSINGYLPCPDTDADGAENRAADRSCTDDFGELPYLELGMEAATPWGSAAFYAVHGRADGNICDTSGSNGAECFFYNAEDAFNLKTDGGATGQLNVAEASGGGDTLATRLQAIVGSYGSNPFALGGNCATTGRSDDEDDNCDEDVNYVLAPYRASDTAAPFDDQLVWIDELTLKSLRLEALAAEGIASSGGGGNAGDGGDGGDGGDSINGGNQPENLDKKIASCNKKRECLEKMNKDNVVVGDDGDDTLDGEQGHDLIVGGEGNDELIGGEGLDTLYGGIGDDTVHGGQGNDFIYGGQGADRLYGDNGKDRFVYPASGGTVDIGVDIIDGGNGADYIYINSDLGTITIKQNDNIYTLLKGESLSVDDSFGELFVDDVKWAEFENISEIVEGELP